MVCFVFLWVPACAGMTREFAGMTAGVCVGIPAVCLRSFGLPHPVVGRLGFAKGVNGVLCFSLGSRLRGKDGGRRVKRPGRYLVRSLSVNGLEFAPPPRSGRGEFDRVVDRACYQQSQTETKYAPVTGPRRGGLPDSRQKSSACVVRRQDVGHAPRTR